MAWLAHSRMVIVAQAIPVLDEEKIMFNFWLHHDHDGYYRAVLRCKLEVCSCNQLKCHNTLIKY